MTKGILGVIACPMLEDELIHSLGCDPEDKDVIVLDNAHNGSLRRKLERSGVAYRTMPEQDFMGGHDDLDRGRYTVVIRMKDLGLHAEPRVLMESIQDELVMLQGHVDAVALYYGMCGNYGWDVSKWAEGNVDYPIAVFRDANGRVCDDCVGVAVGGVQGYLRLIKEFTGVLLYTPAIATNWEDFLAASDMAKGTESLSPGDPKDGMRKILHMCGYTSIVQIDTGLEDRGEFDRATRDCAEYMGFRILQASPDYIDTGPMERIYAEGKSFLDGD